MFTHESAMTAGFAQLMPYRRISQQRTFIHFHVHKSFLYIYAKEVHGENNSREDMGVGKVRKLVQSYMSGF